LLWRRNVAATGQERRDRIATNRVAKSRTRGATAKGTREASASFLGQGAEERREALGVSGQNESFEENGGVVVDEPRGKGRCP